MCPASVDYIHKNSGRNNNVIMQLLKFSYLMLSVNEILQIYYLVFALSGLGGENDISTVKKGLELKSLRNTDVDLL